MVNKLTVVKTRTTCIAMILLIKIFSWFISQFIQWTRCMLQKSKIIFDESSYSIWKSLLFPLFSIWNPMSVKTNENIVMGCVVFLRDDGIFQVPQNGGGIILALELVYWHCDWGNREIKSLKWCGWGKGIQNKSDKGLYSLEGTVLEIPIWTQLRE